MAPEGSGADRVETVDTRRWRGPTASSLVGFGFAIWGLSIGLGRLSDNSLFTHIATGRVILASGIPHHDPYSFTAAGEPWVVQSWLASLVYGLLDRAAGPAAIRVFMGLTTMLLAWLVWLLTRPSRTLLGRILVAGLVLGVGSSVWAPRPLLIGLVALGLTLLAAEKRFPPWLLLPIFWIWVNAHGSFPLGLVVLASLAIGRRLDGGDPSVEVRGLKWAVGGTLLGVLNPLGPVILWFPVHLLGRQDLLRAITEWQSPSFDLSWTRLFLVQVVLAVLLLVRRPSYRAAVPLVIFTAAALLGVRNVAVASIVLVPGMARGLADMGSITGDQRGRLVNVGVALMVVLSLLIGLNSLEEPTFDLTTYPVDAVAFVEQAGWRSPDVRVMTQETAGNYLELLHGTDARVFLDDRVDMFPRPVVEDFLTVLRGHPGWGFALQDHGVDVVIWDAKEPLAQLLAADPGWRIPYTDGRWFVACRRSSVALASQTAVGAMEC